MKIMFICNICEQNNYDRQRFYTLTAALEHQARFPNHTIFAETEYVQQELTSPLKPLVKKLCPDCGTYPEGHNCPKCGKHSMPEMPQSYGGCLSCGYNPNK